MKHWLAALCCLAPLVAHAAIYKSVDADGNVVYSDTPRPGAKEINLPPPPTYTPPPLPTAGTPPTTPPAAPAVAYYTSLRVAKPEPDATIHDNTGAVDIGIEVIPTLNTQAGHKLAIELDGKRLSNGDGTPALRVSNLERGTHTLKAMVVDAQDRVLISSGTTTFYMKRESLLQHKAAPPDAEGDASAPMRNPGNRSDNPNILSPTPNVPRGVTPPQPTH